MSHEQAETYSKFLKKLCFGRPVPGADAYIQGVNRQYTLSYRLVSSRKIDEVILVVKNGDNTVLSR